MGTGKLFVYSTYHLDNSRNIDVNTPKTKSQKKAKQETKTKPSEQSGFYKTKKCMQCAF